MLASAKEALLPEQERQRLAIKLSELEVVKDNYLNVMTIAALIAGFAFTGVSDVDLPQCEPDEEDCASTPRVLEILFYVFISIVFASQMHSITVASVCVVGGHAVAMRGTGGTPNECVDQAMAGMRWCSSHIYLSFVLGLVFFEICSIMVCFAQASYGKLDSLPAGSTIAAIIFIQITLTALVAIYAIKRYFELDHLKAKSYKMFDFTPTKPSNRANDFEMTPHKGTEVATVDPSTGTNRRVQRISTDENAVFLTCTSCRSQVSPEDRFCRACGQTLI